jgi:hypothetical protein
MAGVNFITHNGVKILYEDYSQSKPEELIALLKKAEVIISKEPLNSIRALVNVKGSNFDTTLINTLKDFVKANTPYIKCSAVYGVEGLKEIIFKGIIAFTGRKNLVLFKTLEEAKDYLANLK